MGRCKTIVTHFLLTYKLLSQGEDYTTRFIYLGQTLLCPKELTAFLTGVDPWPFYYACHWEQEQDKGLISEQTTLSCYSWLAHDVMKF